VASANVILTVDCSTVLGPTELGTATPGVLSCPGFQPGTNGIPVTALLSSITLEIDGGIPVGSLTPAVPNSLITITNNNSASQVVDAYTTVNFQLPNAAIALPGFSFTTHAPLSYIFQAIGDTGSQTLPGNSSASYIVAGSASETSTDTNASTYATYEVPSFNFSVDTITAITALAGGGQVGVTQVTDGYATAEVTYEYTPTPEPTTLVLLGSALLGLGFLSSRRRAAR
jgi:hypothetical protein